MKVNLSKATIKQTILTVCVSIAFFGIGLVRGYSAPAIPSMNELNPDLLPNKNIASWVSSIPPFGALIGSLLSGPLMHYMGRKYTVMFSSPIWTTSWILIAIAQRWEILIVGRFLSGLSVGISLPAAQIYVSECSNPEIRGVLGSFPSVSMSGGILVAYILGKYFSWIILARISSVIVASIFFAIIFLPESPVWLKTKNKKQKAAASAAWLHLSGFCVDSNVCEANEKNTQTEVIHEKPFSRKVLFKRPILLPLGIGLALLSIQQLSGIDAVIFFTVEIFRAGGSTVDSHLATIIVGAVQLLSNIFSLFLVDRAGRKPLLITSGIIMCISMASMGASFYLNSIGNTSFGFLPLTSLIIFMIGFSIGFGCIPFLIMGEIFPTAQRSLLSSLAGSFNLAVMFIVIKTYHPLEDLITTAGTFWMYSMLCLFGVFFVITCVPETKGRDLESIARLFVKQNNNNSNNNNLVNSDNKLNSEKKIGIDNLAVNIDDEKIISNIIVNNEDTKL